MVDPQIQPDRHEESPILSHDMTSADLADVLEHGEGLPTETRFVVS